MWYCNWFWYAMCCKIGKPIADVLSGIKVRCIFVELLGFWHGMFSSNERGYCSDYTLWHKPLLYMYSIYHLHYIKYIYMTKKSEMIKYNSMTHFHQNKKNIGENTKRQTCHKLGVYGSRMLCLLTVIDHWQAQLVLTNSYGCCSLS